MPSNFSYGLESHGPGYFTEQNDGPCPSTKLWSLLGGGWIEKHNKCQKWTIIFVGIRAKESSGEKVERENWNDFLAVFGELLSSMRVVWEKAWRYLFKKIRSGPWRPASGAGWNFGGNQVEEFFIFFPRRTGLELCLFFPSPKSFQLNTMKTEGTPKTFVSQPGRRGECHSFQQQKIEIQRLGSHLQKADISGG